MIQKYEIKCSRCEGTGQVYAIKKKPLFCSARRGQFLHKMYVNDSNKLDKACGGNTDDQFMALITLKFHADQFSVMACPDCKGHPVEVYTLEQLPHENYIPQEPEIVA